MTEAEKAEESRYAKALEENEATLNQLEACGAAQCSMREVAAILATTPAELRTFVKKGTDARRAFDKGRALGLKAMREAQIALAQKSVPMASLLGKLYLGQAEQREQDERPKNTGHGSVDRLKRELFGVLAEASEEEGATGG